MDHILYWNAVALEANKRDFSNLPGTADRKPEQGGPTLSSRALAIVHLAMYDAHAGCVGGPNLPRYFATPANPPAGANAAAAVAAAAHATLSALFPRQKPHFDRAHADAGISGAGIDAGHLFGLAVAQAHLAARKSDPGAGDDGYAFSVGRGRHRPDPANPGQGFHAPFYGAQSKGFAITKRHELDAPPAVGTAEYLDALRQVRGKGILPAQAGLLPATLAKRTPDETLFGIFWGYDGARELGTPPRLYNQIVREVAKAQGNTVDANARLFAFVNAAMGDAGILAWDQKYVHDFWRPIVGIREHDTSMGPAPTTATRNIDNDCDPEWLPLGAPSSNSRERDFTPPFPAYPSGHATFGAAALHVTRLFYGIAPGNRSADAVYTNTVVSGEHDGRTTDSTGTVRPRHARRFPGGLWQMIVENGLSRVMIGVHWSFDAFALAADGEPDLLRKIGGVRLGLDLAEDIFAAGGGKAPKPSTVGPRT